MDLPISTKTHIARELRITYACFMKYHNLCFAYLSDFKQDYPVVDSKPYTRSYLTAYQCWVIQEVIKDFLKRPAPVTQSYLENQSWVEKYSKKAFLESQFGSIVQQ